jgi:hypothetical protein
MLCSGSTMGTREGILNYVKAMQAEFDAWLRVEKCRFDIIGDDQSIHDFLYPPPPPASVLGVSSCACLRAYSQAITA